MADSLIHRSQILGSQMDTLAEGYEEQDPSQENITHQAKIFRQQIAQLAPDAGSVEPETENITHAAKLFNQAMTYFTENPPSGGDGSLEMIGQLDTRCYIYNGAIITNKSSPGPNSTYVYKIPEPAAWQTIAILVKKDSSNPGNRCRVAALDVNPLTIPVPSSGQLIQGMTINNVINDGATEIVGCGKSTWANDRRTNYIAIMVSSENGTTLAPKVWAQGY